MAAEPAPPRPGLEQRLGHDFARPELLRLALTHPSAGEPHNERLEFLGDAVLNLAVTEALFERFPSLREGRLSRLRATLVRAETLAELARELDLGPELRLGAHEASSGARESEAILSAALEAVIAAIRLDAGHEAARAAVLRWIAGPLARLDPEVSHKDPKTELQELLQARRRGLPRYEVLRMPGDGGAGGCLVACHVEGLAEAASGSGRNRRIAEQQAARRALERLRSGGAAA